jgi:signal transduction histidine kinase
LRLKLSVPNKETEKFFAKVNKYLDMHQRQQIANERQEKRMKQEIANISHDLRTPLTSILGYMSILMDENLSDQERKEYLDIVRRKGEVMKTLVEAFYELSVVEAKDFAVQKEEVYLYSVLCDTLLAFYRDFESKKIEMVLELEENIAVMMLDRNALIRIISNLVQNSLRYAKSWTKISLKQYEHKLCLIFENDTELLNCSDIDKIFDRTYTADVSRTKGQTGLGLSITKKLVELQDGRISSDLKNNIFSINIEWTL